MGRHPGPRTPPDPGNPSLTRAKIGAGIGAAAASSQAGTETTKRFRSFAACISMKR